MTGPTKQNSQNPKVAPGFKFVINSKISPVLQELSSGVEQL